jgi:ketosteroid isomerase-like protein
MTSTREIVEKYMDHMGKQEFEEAFALYSPEAVYRISGNTKISGAFHGVDAIGAGLGEVLQNYFKTPPKITTHEIIVEGDRGVVIASGVAEGAHGPYNQEFVFVFRVKDGKIIEKVENLDTVMVETALLGKKLV